MLSAQQKTMSNSMGIALYEKMKKLLPIRTLDYHTKPGPPIGDMSSSESKPSPRGCWAAVAVPDKPNGESSWDTFAKIELPWVL